MRILIKTTVNRIFTVTGHKTGGTHEQLLTDQTGNDPQRHRGRAICGRYFSGEWKNKKDRTGLRGEDHQTRM